MKGPEEEADVRDRDGRDVELGARLRELEVPEHAPGFFAALQAKMEAEAEATARGGDEYRRAGDDRRAAGGERRAAPRAGACETGPKRRAWLRLIWVPIPVAAAVLALLWAFAGPLGIDSFKPETASAKEISQKVAAAVTDARALRGTLVIVSPLEAQARDEMRWTFVSTAEGDFRLTGITRAEDLGYDHQTGSQRALSGGENGEAVFASEMTGLAGGLPDPGPAENILERHLGAVVRALLASVETSAAAQVGEDIYEGREVWTLSIDVKVNLLVETSSDHMEVAVDKQTGFPVRIVETREGQFVQETRLEDLEIDPVLSADSFRVEFPAGGEVIQTDAGFDRIAPAELGGVGADVVGYVPALPASVPDGFALTEVAVAEVGQASGKEGMNPAVPGVVSAVYRRGFDRLVVSTRTVGDDPSLWSDPLASGEGFIDTPETLTLTAGAFSGSVAELLIDARTVPHLWAMNDTLVVTVSGDLTREELVVVAESLTPVE